MRINHHHHELPPRELMPLFRRYDRPEHKIAVWNAFADSGLSGVNDDDCSILPRVLPLSYLREIRRSALEITTFAMRLLSLPEPEIRAIIPHGPIRDFLIDELKVLKHRPARLVGSFRFDMAVVGTPQKGNPPKLLEINEIGFDGLARSSFIQRTLLELMPELRKKVFALDTAALEVRNMQRLGNKIARLQTDCYNWDEEYLVQSGRTHGAEISLVSPEQLGYDIDARDFPLMKHEKISFAKNKVKVGKDLVPDAVQLSFAFTLGDYQRGRDLYARIVRSQTPHYGPFLMGLVASKMILVLLSDPTLRRKLLGSARKLQGSILPATPLEGRIEDTRDRYSELVLKHTDGFGGEQVFMDHELLRNLKRIEPRKAKEWIIQERTKLNTLTVNGILSRPRKVISDLGVFIHYDWSKGKFNNLGISGFITRATNRSFKVNVSGGGIQVPVMFLRGR